MEASGNTNSLAPNIIQNIFFCAPQKEVIQVWNNMRIKYDRFFMGGLSF